MWPHDVYETAWPITGLHGTSHLSLEKAAPVAQFVTRATEVSKAETSRVNLV